MKLTPTPPAPFRRVYQGRDELRRVESPDLQPMPPLIACRTLAASPFEPGMLYFGGYDPNEKPCRHTAWAFSASTEAALAPAR